MLSPERASLTFVAKALPLGWVALVKRISKRLSVIVKRLTVKLLHPVEVHLALTAVRAVIRIASPIQKAEIGDRDPARKSMLTRNVCGQLHTKNPLSR